MVNKVFHPLKEGSHYPFRVEGTVQMPDGQNCLKIKDPNGVNHLLDAMIYRNYNLHPGQMVQCRIDKLNCSGKIYIEPEHPYYRVGGSYTFRLIRFDSFVNGEGIHEPVGVFTDQMGNEMILPRDEFEGRLDGNNEIEGKVMRIRLGKIYIFTDLYDKGFENIHHGDWHTFWVNSIRSYGERFDFFLLSDQEGRNYRLRRKYYASYGLAKGQEIRCRMIRNPSGWFFEPEHPVYKPGSTYEFKIIERKKIPLYPNRQQEVYILDVKQSKEITLPVENTGYDLSPGSTITLLVQDIQKGRVLPSDPVIQFQTATHE